MGEDVRLPEDPTLRAVATMLEQSRVSGEIFDYRWCVAFISTEQMRIAGLDPDGRGRYYGISPIVRQLRFGDEFGVGEDAARTWWRLLPPVIRHDVAIDDPDFDEIFDVAAEQAKAVEPVTPPAALTFSLEMSAPFRLARGDTTIYERMDRLRDPGRRPAAILFADLAASGELSRRLSSRAYFELIRSLTDLIDREVAARRGILGKHAGDGASALFLAQDEPGNESGAARAAIEAARTIRDGARALGGEDGPEVRVKVGIHWGATLTVGQVSTGGRLEVTALGDEMNEAARIESAAAPGIVLASKDLIERLWEADAKQLSIEPDSLTYRTIAELTGGEKEVRDAGSIAVVEV